MWAALGEGWTELGGHASFFQNQVYKSRVNASPVILYLPVSPVAPPKSTALFLLTAVIVCPNLGDGISPKVSSY